MGIGSYILAGALQGAGNGISQQGASDVEARRQAALETLRAENAQKQATFQAGITDGLDARKQKRTAAYATELASVQTQRQITVDNNRGVLAKDKAAVDYGYDVKLEKVRNTNRIALEGLQHSYRLSEDAASFARKADQDAKDARDRIDRWDVDQDGNMIGFSKTGRVYRSKVKLQRKGEGDDALSMPGAKPTAAPSPAAAPTRAPQRAQAAGDPAAAPRPRIDNPDEVDPNWLATYGAGGTADPFKDSAAKVYSMADLRHTAQANNMSIPEARAWLAKRGYSLGN